MKKTWTELIVCTHLLGIIIAGVFLTDLLVQAAYGMVTPPEVLTDRASGLRVALGFLYYLILFGVAFVALQQRSGGIAVLGIYRSAKSRQIHGFPEPEPNKYVSRRPRTCRYPKINDTMTFI